MIGKEEVSLYFHIPFCSRKCDYCHFYVLPNKGSFHLLLLEALFLELEKWRSEFSKKSLASIYFGGGTPSLLSPPSVETILNKVQSLIPFSAKEIEITLEANPDTLTKEKVAEFASAGINRLSIGVQSLDDRLLMLLGRTHYAEAALKAIELAVNSEISNVSVDLMYDIPGQTLQAWMNTLQQISRLSIVHLSLYNLTIEPHTVFFKYRDTLIKELPNEEISVQMYQTAVAFLNSCGLRQYEISAFAKPGFHSRHNTGYWTGRSFLGFGPSAFSYWKGERFRNLANLHRYWRALKDGLSPVDFSEKLDFEKRQRELFIIGLRMLSGVDLTLFEASHGVLDSVLYKVIADLIAEGFLEQKNSIIKLSQKGILFYDTIAVEIVM